MDRYVLSVTVNLAIPVVRVPECQHGAVLVRAGRQLRVDGPGGGAPLGAAEHRTLRRRPRQRDAPGARHRRLLHTVSHHVSHRDAR